MRTCNADTCGASADWRVRVHLHGWVRLCTGCLVRAVHAQTDETRETGREEFPLVSIEPLQPA